MVPIIMSLGIVAAGLWLVLGESTSDMVTFGAVLLVVGLPFLVFNLYARHRGPLSRRRP